MFTKLKTKKSQSGVTMIEYALIAALIAIVVMAALGPLGTTIAGKFTEIATSVTGAGN